MPRRGRPRNSLRPPPLPPPLCHPRPGSARERRTLQPIILYAALLWPYLVSRKFYGPSIGIYESNRGERVAITPRQGYRAHYASISLDNVIYVYAC